MNSQSANTRSKGLSMSQLIQKNADALETRQQTPYQPIVYALPAEWREKEEQMLADAVQFQPRLYQLIGNLATEEDWKTMLEQQKAVIQREHTSLENRLTQTLQQDGKTREQFSLDWSRQLSDSIRKLEDINEAMHRKYRNWILITGAVSALSSMLAFVLCLLLNG